MTTLTIKVNEKTKAGKAFMIMAETFFKDADGIEIIKTLDKAIEPYPENMTLLQQLEIGLAELKEIKEKNLPRKTLSELLAIDESN